MKSLSFRHLAKCNKCPELGKEHVPACGNPVADIMLIGQSPGETEVYEKQPFVGPSGELVDYLLDYAELDRMDVYITNILKCRPPGNRPGQPDELACCMKTWMAKELKYVNPAIVVLIGKDAWQTVTGGRIPFKHGTSHKGKKRQFLTLYHPAYFLRRGDLQTFVENGGAELRRLYESL